MKKVFFQVEEKNQPKGEFPLSEIHGEILGIEDFLDDKLKKPFSGCRWAIGKVEGRNIVKWTYLKWDIATLQIRNY